MVDYKLGKNGVYRRLRRQVFMKFLSILVVLFSMQTHAAGGVSGGGGNLISPVAPTEKQDPKEIKNIINGSDCLLKRFLKAQHSLYTNGKLDVESQRLYTGLFSDKENNIDELLESISLDIPIDKPCFDNVGNAFDGSTFSPKNHSICISAYSIAIKSGKNDVLHQAPALILHELSELTGLSDDDAILLQKQALDEMKTW